MEYWKYIQGTDNLYLASNLGRIKSVTRSWMGKKGMITRQGRILKQVLSKNGRYLHVTICIKGKQKSCDVHKLVAMTFHEKKDELFEVNHIDTNKLNNCANNLEWCSREQNIAHALKNINIKYSSGINHYKSKKVIDINTGKIYNSVKEASLKNKINYSTLIANLNNRLISYSNYKYIE